MTWLFWSFYQVKGQSNKVSAKHVVTYICNTEPCKTVQKPAGPYKRVTFYPQKKFRKVKEPFVLPLKLEKYNIFMCKTFFTAHKQRTCWMQPLLSTPLWLQNETFCRHSERVPMCDWVWWCGDLSRVYAPLPISSQARLWQLSDPERRVKKMDGGFVPCVTSYTWVLLFSQISCFLDLTSALSTLSSALKICHKTSQSQTSSLMMICLESSRSLCFVKFQWGTQGKLQVKRIILKTDSMQIFQY